MPGELIPIIAIIFGCTIPMVAIWAKHKEKVAQMQIEALRDIREVEQSDRGVQLNMERKERA